MTTIEKISRKFLFYFFFILTIKKALLEPNDTIMIKSPSQEDTNILYQKKPNDNDNLEKKGIPIKHTAHNNKSFESKKFFYILIIYIKYFSFNG